jgi:hypothetical protein
MDEATRAVKAAKKWASKIGHTPAVMRLVSNGVAISTAEKICAGRYESTPRSKLTKVLIKEMKKDGFSSEGEIAS